ncbi:MAG: tetratricopeptide repeat protein [Desulfobacterales bacterium]|nr:tetratricopeptide repeat protein [Desulfobacterales bacterium]
MNKPQKNLSNNFKPFIFFSILICLIYSNTFNSPFQLDDYQNITRNAKIHMQSFSLDAVVDSFYATPTQDSLYRPLSYFSLSLNWLWGGDDVTGYHIVNTTIHLLTAFFLFLTVRLLLRTPNVKGLDHNTIYFVALLSATIWCIHPIQIQAVTYIVQRMASMAALFYIIGIFCYLKARMTKIAVHRLFWWGFCALSFLFAIGSKNNAMMLPVVLLLMEFIFFRDLKDRKTQKLAASMFIIGAFLVAAAGVFIFMDGNFNRYLERIYEVRPFSWQQRLMTQPSVLLFYLFQIFYPTVEHYSITHDFPISVSLLNPWTTLPAILINASLIGVAVWRIRKNPVLSFAILFYYCNHVIESSILPLEMVFEHRNYLPTLFLFVPISIGIKKGLDHYFVVKKPMFAFLIFSICTALIGLGISTYVRNYDWRSVQSIWADARKKAPGSARPLHNLAYGYYEPTGQTGKALELYHKALNLTPNLTLIRADTYNNMASIYFSDLKDYEKAIEYAKKAIEIYPHHTSTLILCDSLSLLGRYDQAMAYLDELLKEHPHDTSFLYRNGFLRLKTGKPNEALNFLQACLQKSPENYKYLRDIGFCLSRLNKYERGYWFLRRAQNIRPKSPGVLLCVAENQLLAGKIEAVNETVDQLIELIGVPKFEKFIIKIFDDPLGLPIIFEDITPVISDRIRDRSKSYLAIADRLERKFLLNN